jgi:transglutaminase-like putative cysteine protease
MTTHANVFAFVAGAVGYLALLVAEGRDRARSWGRRLSGVEHADDVADVSHVARVGRRIGTAAVGIALCVPVAVPSVGKGMFSEAGGGPFGRGGRGSHTAVVINPIVEIKAQLLDHSVRTLFTVRTDSPAYLRLTPLDVFDGDEWKLVRQEVNSDHKVSAKKRIPAPDRLSEITTAPATYDVNVSALAVRWLPLPYVPSTVDVAGDWRYEDAGLSVFSAERTTQGVHYVATSNLPVPTPAQLEAPGPIPTHIQPYLDVPSDTPQKAVEVLNEVTKGATTSYQKAVALTDYFFKSGGFRYSLEVAAGNNKDALVNFLINKVGYCEQFAATMAYLSRLAGIPARVVVGFTPGTLHNDGTYVVTNRDAHAWPELWFPHAGWVRFEPTPSSDGRTQQPSYVPSTSVADPGTQPSGGPTQPGPSASASPSAGPNQRANADDLVDQSNDPLAQAARRRRSGSLPLLPLAAAVLAVALVTPAAVAWGTRRRRRSRAGGHVGRIHAAWETLADAAEDSGYALRAADSPRAAARRLVSAASLVGPAADEVRRLAAAEERARYARSVDPVDGLDGGVRLVARALRASLPRWARLRATVFPASALRRVVDFGRLTGARVDRTRARSRGWLLGLVRRRARTA